MKKTYRDNSIKKYLGGIYAFVFVVTASLLVFLVCVQNSIDNNSKQSMKHNVSRQSEHLYSILDTHFQYLKAIASDIGTEGEEQLLSDENISLIKNMQKDSDLEHVAIIDTKGIAYYDNGNTSDVSGRRYFKEGISGKQTLSDPLTSNIDQETRVVLGVPIYHDSEIIGVLGGSYNVTELSRAFFNDSFDGVGYTLIVTKEGNIIAYDGDEAYRKITYGDNFFDFFSEKKFSKANILDKVKEDFNAGNDGVIAMRNPGRNQLMQYMAYTDLNMNDWMICYVIPVTEAQKSYQFIIRYEIILLMAFFVSALVFAIYIRRKNRQRNAELLRNSQIDRLTGLYNKITTENMIEDYVGKEDKNSAGMFFIMDIDCFKSINDNYGHLVGDMVLKEFAAFLKENVPQDAIVGRIGGDEFVVFLPECADVNSAVKLADSLVNSARRLEFKEMDRNISISMGISIHPDNGNDFMSLYKLADTALYESKKNGRNRYTLYKE